MITLNKKRLETVLKRASYFIPKSSMIPILNNILIEQHPEEIRIIADNLESSYSEIMETENQPKDFTPEEKQLADIAGLDLLNQTDTGEYKTTIPAKAFIELLKIQKGDTITLDLYPDYILLNGIKLAGLHPEEYPKQPTKGETVNSYQIQAHQLENLINNVTPGLAKKGESNLAFNCMLLETNSNEITAVTTDGQRLVISKEWINQDAGPDSQDLIPKETTDRLAKLLKAMPTDFILTTTARPLSITEQAIETEARRESKNRHEREQLAKPENERTRFKEPTRKADTLFLENGRIQITSRIIDGVFPEYKRVIPENPKYKYTIDKTEIATALNSIIKTRTKDSRQTCTITLHPTESIIESEDTETEPHISQTIPTNNERGEGSQEINLRLDSKKFLDSLTGISTSQIMLQTNGQFHPIIITDQDQSNRYTYILVSLRPKGS